jgi:hypothetical protein
MNKVALNFSRIFVGVLFIFSGLIKANDTLGFGYKLEEYFDAPLCAGNCARRIAAIWVLE